MTVKNPLIEKELKKLRSEINKQDRILLLALKNRFKVIKKVALLKKKYNMPVLQKDRWKNLFDDRIKISDAMKLNPKFVSAIMKLIHKESISYQLTFQNKKEKK